MDKIKTVKLITDLAGFGIGGVVSGIMVIATYSFLKHGGYILYEQNKIISLAEFVAAIFGTGYFGYRILKLLTKKELEKYIEREE